MRLRDGRLWLPREEAPAAEEPVEAAAPPRLALWRLRHPAPWIPALLWLLTACLGLLPAPATEAQLDLVARRVGFRLARNATVLERLDLREIAATQLAALRLPSALAVSNPWATPAGGRLVGVRLATLGEPGTGAQLTLQPPLLRAGTEVSLEHAAPDGRRGSAYRLSLAGSDRALTVVFRGDVVLQRLDAPVGLRLDRPDSLDLYPQGGILELDLDLARFTAGEIAAGIPIDRLSVLRIVERHTDAGSEVKEESTLLAGEVRVRPTGERHRLARGEHLLHAGLAGSLTTVELGQDGIRLRFQGRVSRLARAAEGLRPESLMPSVLDLWMPGPAQAAAQAVLGVLAAAVLLLAVTVARPRSRNAPPAEAAAGSLIHH
jgi:hypothetical protein